uniref:Uncharacterized protein n=1 Tax=Manihot esculenta TaxID=3983 RepID=A0A199UBW4_MANES
MSIYQQTTYQNRVKTQFKATSRTKPQYIESIACVEKA